MFRYIATTVTNGFLLNMKKIFFLMMFFVLIGAACTPKDREPAGQASRTVLVSRVAYSDESPWKTVRQIDVEQPLRTAAFLNLDFGFTGGPSEEGKAHVTRNGGQSWLMAQSSADCLFGLDIVGESIIWQCSLGPVGVSADGGRTWRSVSSYGNYCRQVSFLDETTGWIASNVEIGMTRDGGGTWNQVSLPDLADDIAAIWLRTAQDGYVLDISGILYITSDGGEHWTRRRLELGLEDQTLPSAETATAAVRFFDANRGLIVLQRLDHGRSRVEALHTNDGGESWVLENVMETPMLISLYLSHDGSILTVTDTFDSQIYVIEHSASQKGKNG